MDSCWFLGQQKNVYSILRKSNIFVLPSGSEGLSTVLLEAMKNKVPVIACDIAGNRELIQHGFSGWLVKVGDITELSAAIIKAYQQPLLMKRMAEEAFNNLDTYTLSSVSDQYLQVYSSLTKPRGKRVIFSDL